MKAPPLEIGRKIKVALIAAGVVILLAAALGVVLFFQLTASAPPASVSTHSMLDAEEAGRKLKQFADSMKGNRKGFIRLSDQEVNAHLQAVYLSAPKGNSAGKAAVSCALKDARVRLGAGATTWYAWVQCHWLGRPWNFLWQRTVAPVRRGDHWEFEVTGMRVGRLKIPTRIWPRVQSFLGEADLAMVDPYNWLIHLPTVEIKANEISKTPELVLYNYSDPPAALRGK